MQSKKQNNSDPEEREAATKPDDLNLNWTKSSASPTEFQSGAKSSPAATGDAAIDLELRKAWAEQLKKGFAYNDKMFQTILDAFMQPYTATLFMYRVLFWAGIGLFVVAVLASAISGQILFSVLFGGLGVGVFLAFFISRPLQALEENLEFITWLGGTYNSYWAKLLEIRDNKTALAELKQVSDEFDTSMERLITKHAEMRGKRPVTDPSALRDAMAAVMPSLQKQMRDAAAGKSPDQQG